MQCTSKCRDDCNACNSGRIPVPSSWGDLVSAMRKKSKVAPPERVDLALIIGAAAAITAEVNATGNWLGVGFVSELLDRAFVSMDNVTKRG